MTYTKKFKTYSNRAEMERDGWIFDGDGQPKPCRECGADIEWAKSPRGKNVSIDYQHCTVHFTHCGTPAAPGPTAPRPATAAAPSPQGELTTALNDLATAVRSGTGATLALLAELKSRPRPPAPAPARPRFDSDGCPQ
jgi:hypothetical protein